MGGAEVDKKKKRLKVGGHNKTERRRLRSFQCVGSTCVVSMDIGLLGWKG